MPARPPPLLAHSLHLSTLDLCYKNHHEVLMTIRRIGVLTGGGDAPGLNPALKAIVYRATTMTWR